MPQNIQIDNETIEIPENILTPFEDIHLIGKGYKKTSIGWGLILNQNLAKLASSTKALFTSISEMSDLLNTKADKTSIIPPASFKLGEHKQGYRWLNEKPVYRYLATASTPNTEIQGVYSLLTIPAGIDNIISEKHYAFVASGGYTVTSVNPYPIYREGSVVKINLQSASHRGKAFTYEILYTKTLDNASTPVI